MKKILFFIFYSLFISCSVKSQGIQIDSGKGLQTQYFLKNNNTLYNITIDSSSWTLKKSWKSYRIPMIFLALSGIVDGFHESATHHYGAFKRNFPKINDRWWNPEISWANKYKNYDQNQGEQFLFSTTALVMLTDWYHLSRSIENGFNITAICTSIPISIKNPEPKNNHVNSGFKIKKNQKKYVSFGLQGKQWWIYGIEFFVLSSIKRIFFEITFKQLEK